MSENINEDKNKYDSVLQEIAKFINKDNECRFIFFGYGNEGEILLAGGQMTIHHALGMIEHIKLRMTDKLRSLVCDKGVDSIDDLLREHLQALPEKEAEIEATIESKSAVKQ